MALEGNVKDFGLSEILQLIALQKKTGMLSITGEQTMVIYFREGQVISTRDRRKMADDPLSNFLLKYGFLSAEEMDRIQRVQTDTNLDLADLLVSEKRFSDDELRTIFVEQIQETIQEVLSWPKSQYKFIIGSHVLQGVKSFEGLKVEGLLMESMRRIDEFPELERIFPSEETIVRRLPTPKGSAPELEELERSIYDLLENRISIGDLLPKAQATRFGTYEALKSLLEKGLLQIIAVEKPAEVAAEEPAGTAHKPRRSALVPAAIAFGSLIVCFLLGELAVPLLSPPGWGLARRGAVQRGFVDTSSVAPNLAELKVRLLEAAAREGLEEHFAMKGAYPANLETLVSARLLPQGILDELNARRFSFRVDRGGESYSLERSRP